MDSVDVFISYAHEDGAAARAMAAVLEGEGFSVWWDRHLLPGARVDEAIRRQLDEAGAVLVLWSPSSVGARWVVDEAEQALQQDKLVPVLIAATEIPLGMRRIFTLDLSGWTGDPSDPLLRPLFTRLRASAPVPPAGGPAKPIRASLARRGALAAILAAVTLVLALATVLRPRQEPGPVSAPDAGPAPEAQPVEPAKRTLKPDAGAPKKKSGTRAPAVASRSTADAGLVPSAPPPSSSPPADEAPPRQAEVKPEVIPALAPPPPEPRLVPQRDYDRLYCQQSSGHAASCDISPKVHAGTRTGPEFAGLEGQDRKRRRDVCERLAQDARCTQAPEEADVTWWCCP